MKQAVLERDAATRLGLRARYGVKDGSTPPTPPATPPAQDEPMTADAVKKLVGEALQGILSQGIKLSDEQIKAIEESIKKAATPPVVVPPVAPPSPPTDSALKADDIKKLINDAFDGFRREHKSIFSAGDSRVEVPVSWSKGNLPLHGKQLLNILMRRPQNEGIDEAMITKGVALGENVIHGYKSYARMLEKNRSTPGMKALTSGGSNTGDELVPSDLSSELQRRLYLTSNLAAVMSAREIDMPTNPFVLPLSTTRPSFYLESTENTAATDSTPGTGSVTLTASRLVGQTNYSYEINEDSIIPLLPMLQMLLAEAAADAWEHAMINGDDTATHMDTDEELLTKSPAFAFKGFRKLALAISGLKTSLASGGVTTNANMLAVRKLLGKYGGDPRNLIWLASPTDAITMQGIAEVASLEKFGSRATILTGEVAALQGIPIIQSERVRTDIDATGVNGSSGNTKSNVQIVNFTRFLTGRRNEFLVETDKVITSGTNRIVASFRKAFTPIETPSATITSVAIGYNF